jgi:secreted trypsin-like serine protease
MFSWILLVGFLAICSSSPVPSDDDGKIVGGKEINISDAPYQISLQYYGSHICGGSLIGENWVLTVSILF